MQTIGHFVVMREEGVEARNLNYKLELLDWLLEVKGEVGRKLAARGRTGTEYCTPHSISPGVFCRPSKRLENAEG
jgi:hypothetical protein